MIADIIPKVATMERENPHKFYPRPSLAGPERCIRQMVYWGLDTPHTPLAGRAILIFDDSSWHEELTGDWIQKTAYRLHSQQMEIECPPPIANGHIDGILTGVDQKDILFEHKAINHFTFQSFWNNDTLPLDYLTQCAIYMNGLQKVNPDLNYGLLLIKNKNTAQYMEYLLRYDYDCLIVINKTNSIGETIDVRETIDCPVQEAISKFEKTLEYVEKKTLPKRPYDIDHWRCEYCAYNQTCWKNYEKEFAELKSDAMLPDEVATMVRYYRELGGQKSDIEKEYKKLSTDIKNFLKEIDTRHGIAGEYIVERRLQNSVRLDKSLIPKPILEKASKISPYERLYIRKQK